MEILSSSAYRMVMVTKEAGLSIDVSQQQALKMVEIAPPAGGVYEQVHISVEGRKQLQDDVVSQPARRFFFFRHR